MIHRFDTVDSTQSVAADLVARGVPPRTAIVAERQTAGYGRKGDVWQDMPGACLLMTLIVRPAHHPLIAQYAMVAALACIDAIRETTGHVANLKWPNDVLLNGHKVAGILGDATWRGAQLEALRIGIGMNITEARAIFVGRGLPDASSIAAEAGRAVDRETVLRVFLSSFARWEDALSEGNARIVAAWRANVATIGEPVVATRVDGRVITGCATGVTDDGDLIVATEAGAAVHLRASDIRSLRYAD